jgi:rubredoxin
MDAVHVCIACGLVYDPAQGLPEYGIAPGTPWDELPPDWRSPECLAGKQDFAALDA